MVVHHLELVKVLLGVDELIQQVLEALLPFLQPDLLVLHDGLLSLFELVLQTDDLLVLMLLLV